MRPRLRLFIKTALVSLSFTTAPLIGAADAVSIVVSVPEQKLYVFDDAGQNTATYRVSTSKYGVGNHRGSYETPLGQLEIAGKVGTGAAPGTVFKGCHRTGEVLKANARGRDPIVTRILPLRGLDKQNSSAYGRRIYIHGTPEESRIGRPVSYGCIRMRSRDVIALYDSVTVGTKVEITEQRLSRGMFASVTRPPTVGSAPAPEPIKPVASVKVTKGKTAITSPKSVVAKPAPAPKQETGKGALLLKASGLTISFGNNAGEAPDAPR